MKIYTKTGDRGDTGLLGPLRVGKDHPRIAAYGSVDELNASVGLARALEAGASRPAPASRRGRSAAARSAPRGGGKKVAARAKPRAGVSPRPGTDSAAWEASGSVLAEVQEDLFVLGAMLATPTGSRAVVAPLGDDRVVRLENAIDAATKALPALATFVLPGGAPLAAQLHVARTVCRRAERDVVALSRSEPLEPVAVAYLNRLSDLLFTLARAANAAAGVAEQPWPPAGKQAKR